jgi:hypothetical protein
MAKWNSSRIVLEACRNRQDGLRGSDGVDTPNASILGRWGLAVGELHLFRNHIALNGIERVSLIPC